MLKIQMPTRVGFHLVLLVTLLVGCHTPGPATTPQTPARTATRETTSESPPPASATPALASTTTAISTATPTDTPVPQLCSPLEEIDLEVLPELVSNPFAPPPPGSDLPHQGLDLSLLDPVGGYALEGQPVQAALAGEVAVVIYDRFPYGYALLIETPDPALPPMANSTLRLPTPLPQMLIPANLTCPQPETNNPALLNADQGIFSPDDQPARSIYILYAHLQGPPDFTPGEQVQCGQRLGLVGKSGNALHPHLHIEIRVGPSGMRFGSLAHYDNSATQAEMASYCTWRVSGIFQLVDPMALFSLAP